MNAPLSTLWDAIVFDFDGTLCDSLAVKGAAYGALYADEGPAVEQAMIRFHLENGGVSRREKLERFETEILRRPVSEGQLDALVARFAETVERAVVAAAWIPGALEFVAEHSGALPMFVISATPHDETVRIVQARGVSGHFVSVHGGPCDKAAVVRTLLERHGIAAHRAAFVGDAIVDHEAAVSTGLAFAGVRDSDGHHPFPPGTLVIDDLRGLEMALRQLAARRGR